MSRNLVKRVFTSLLLLSMLSVCLFLNKYTWLLLIIIASIISFFEFTNLVKKIWKNKVPIINFITISCFFYLLIFIYSGYFFYEIGIFDLILSLLICIFSDIGGYVIGKTIGGKKLTKISPNKTISGSIGSFLFSLFPVVIFYYKIQEPLIEIIFYCLVISLVCQLGDLLISYFKRRAKVKDTGTILPGHGGILDRIDGIIFGLPFGLLILILFF